MTRRRHEHSTAVFVLLLCGREVCLLRRMGTGWMDGSFSLPAGGLEAGETIAAAACREAREEVGVTVTPTALRHVHVLHACTAGSEWVGHILATTTWTGTPRICEPGKHADLTWRRLDDLPDGMIPYVRQALACIDQGIAYSEFGWTDPAVAAAPDRPVGREGSG